MYQAKFYQLDGVKKFIASAEEKYAFKLNMRDTKIWVTKLFNDLLILNHSFSQVKLVDLRRTIFVEVLVNKEFFLFRFKKIKTFFRGKLEDGCVPFSSLDEIYILTPCNSKLSRSNISRNVVNNLKSVLETIDFRLCQNQLKFGPIIYTPMYS